MIQLKNIRTQVVADLVAANITGVLAKVYPSRARPVWKEEGDLLLVYTTNTDAEDQDTAPVEYMCTTDLVVQVVVQGQTADQDLEDRLDQITAEVVDTLQPLHGIAGPLAGYAEWVTFRGIRPTLSADGEILKGSQHIIFAVKWRVALPNGTSPDDFLRVGTELGAPTATKASDLDTDFTTDTRTP